MVSDAIQEKIILQLLEEIKLKSVDQNLHWPLITKSGTNDFGKTIHYYYNYSSDKAQFVYPHNTGLELLSDKKVAKGENLMIDPWGVVIIEE